MKKLLFALVVIAAMLTLSACSESTGIGEPTDDGLTDVLAVEGTIYEVSPSFPWPGVNGATVKLYKWGTASPVHQTTSSNGGWPTHDGFYLFYPGCFEGTAYYKVTATHGIKTGSSGWFYWSYQENHPLVNVTIE